MNPNNNQNPIPSHEDWLDSTRRVTLADGLTMAYVEAGNPAGEPLVMIHGISDSSRNWRTIMMELAETCHLYAIDLRGFGQTDKPDAFAYTAAQYAADVKHFMDQMHLETAWIAGHSMGSMVAQTVAYSYPERVRGVMLISTFAHMHERPEDLTAVTSLYNHLNIQALSDEDLLKEFIPDPDILYDPEFVTGYLKTVRGITGKIMRSAWYSMSVNDNRNFLQFIQAPVMVIWGSEDEIFTKEYQEELKQYLPDALYIDYEGISHDVITQDPIRTAADMKRFMQSAGASVARRAS